jgi:hypothetical protein
MDGQVTIDRRTSTIRQHSRRTGPAASVAAGLAWFEAAASNQKYWFGLPLAGHCSSCVPQLPVPPGTSIT